ncbi:salicylate hydroxylase [Colletotrichum tofieldiae]|nr:salicylate hydroxylase [Colletotrichum tofieldiae]
MLDVAIIGGGIAGLTAATALRRAGHSVTIYEKSALNNEIGAAINVQTNASRPLLALGMDPARARFVAAKGSRRVRGDTLESVHELNLGAIGEKYGSPWYFAHRVDLHQELKRMATADDGGPPVAFRLRSEVTSYDPERARFGLRDGAVVSADLVIVADGIHSGGVEAILGSPNPAFPAAQDNFCYRFLIPMEDVLADPTTAELFDGASGGTGTTQSTSLFLWNASPTFTPVCYRFSDQGQGGAQAIEDGVALGVCLSNVTSGAEVPERLEVFERIRRNRASAVTIFSNAAQDEAEKIREAASEFVPVDRIPTNPEGFYDFHFDYDIVEDSTNHMRKLHPEFRLPDSFLRREVSKLAVS